MVFAYLDIWCQWSKMKPAIQKVEEFLMALPIRQISFLSFGRLTLCPVLHFADRHWEPFTTSQKRDDGFFGGRQSVYTSTRLLDKNGMFAHSPYDAFLYLSQPRMYLLLWEKGEWLVVSQFIRVLRKKGYGTYISAPEPAGLWSRGSSILLALALRAIVAI